MDRLATPLLLLFASLPSAATGLVERPEWRAHFAAKGLEGTFVLFDPAADRDFVLDPARARKRFLPASTFKIPNALIGLEVGSIADEREVYRWDGKPKMRAAWEADQTLATGMRESTVWMFQEVARRTGKARMKEWLVRLDYGNRDISGGIDLFWLQGGLRVSALEQVRFLHRLAEGRLPATQRAQRLVRAALLQERRGEYALYAKTGTTGGRDGIAWWVGWVERRGRVSAVFALNHSPSGGEFGDRLAIGRAILAQAGAFP